MKQSSGSVSTMRSQIKEADKNSCGMTVGSNIQGISRGDYSTLTFSRLSLQMTHNGRKGFVL